MVIMAKEISIGPIATKVVPPPKSRNGLGGDISDTIINVKVGPKENERIFQIHKAKLTGSSPHINKKVRDGGVSKKGDDLPITFREVDSSVFKLFHWWLYTDKLAETGRVKDISWDSLIRSWIFGSSYGIPHFQDAAMNAMIDVNFLPSDKLDYIYKHTGQDSPLRRLCRDRFTVIFHLNHSKDWFGGKKSDYPPDFLIDVIGELHRQRENLRHKENHTKHTNQYPQFIPQHLHRYLLKPDTKVTKS